MGVIIRWVPPDPASKWDTVRIYRETSESGSFSSVYATVPISESVYFDATGSSGHYYKISFYWTKESEESALSEVIQGGDFRGYCTPEDVYDMSGISQKKVSVFDMAKYIELASAQLNADIGIEVENEKVAQIDDVKKNKIDGSNTTFYTKHYPIGDRDHDSEVTVSDIKVYTVDGDGTRTEVSVSSITPNTGKFVLSSAPSQTLNRIELDYIYTPVSVDDPHPLVRLATINLASAFAFSRINVGKAKSIKMGTFKMLRHMESFDIYFNRYQSIVYRINQNMADRKEGEADLFIIGDYNTGGIL